MGTTPATSQNGTSTNAKPRAAARSMLGARQKPGTSITPRSLASTDYFRKPNDAAPSAKKFKTSAPKGSKLAKGYVDRTKGQRGDEEADETAQYIKELEERVKLGELEQDAFEMMREEITGGDVSLTHLVKGLDRKLLERVRRGEDVLQEPEKTTETEMDQPEDLDDEFEELEKHEIVANAKEQKVKQGEKAPLAAPATIAGQKRTRDQILADMKAQRQAAKAAARPQLGPGFKKIRRDEGPRIERDEQGRDVLITMDEYGNIKRKVRKAKPDTFVQNVPIEPTKANEEVLGADITVPEKAPVPEEDSDEDIFASAGRDFNPLADLDGDASSDGEEGAVEESTSKSADTPTDGVEAAHNTPSEKGEENEVTKPTPVPRNYFNDDVSSLSVLSNIKNDLNVSALANSRHVAGFPDASDNVSPEEAAKRKRHQAMLASQDRDMEDMDMGFGASRFDDQEEMAMEGTKVKLSKWKGLAKEEDGEDGEGENGGKEKQRKRGAKKRKGDKNSAADVLSIIEGKKKG